MKYFIISDIHGAADELQTVLNIYKNGKYDKMIILGDILYHGPRNNLPNDYNPKKCIALLNAMYKKIIAIKGNCDAEVDQMVLNFKLYKKKDLKLNDYTIHLEHGHKFLNNYDNYDIILLGHSHVARLEKNESKVIIANPGSISIPKENSLKCYIELSDKEIALFDFKQNLIKSIELN